MLASLSSKFDVSKFHNSKILKNQVSMLSSKIVSVILAKNFLCKNKGIIKTIGTCRHYASIKKFYKKTGVLFNDGMYEITLDQRKLKTPLGSQFHVESEPLAFAVAAEWDSQTKNILQSSMHLSSLCSTVLDNPNKLTKYDMVNYMVNYLSTDTVLFQSYEDDALYDIQKKEWDPIIQWFCDRFGVDMKKSRDISAPDLNQETKNVLTKHFLSYNFSAINGYTYGIDSLKSVILMLACVEKILTPEKAVYLSRLEEEYQSGFWGRVEWAHDLQQQDLQTRVSAAVLFVYFNSSSVQQQSKLKKQSC